MLEPAAVPVDPEELTKLTRDLRATSYHERVEEYVRDRIAFLLDDDVDDPYIAMKRRGQVEELQHLLRPGFTQTLALLGLRRRAEATAAAMRDAPPEVPLERPWWVDPEMSAASYPVP